MNLKIRSGTARYNNKILVSGGKFSLGKNENVNLMKSTQTDANSNDVLSFAPAISQKNQEPKTITHNDEKIVLVLALAGGFAIWNIFQ